MITTDVMKTVQKTGTPLQHVKILIPSAIMRNSITKNWMDRNEQLVNTVFQTLTEWLSEKATDHLIEEDKVFLTPNEQAQLMLHVIEEVDTKAFLQEHQIDIDLARLFVSVRQQMLKGYDTAFDSIYPQYKPSLQTIFMAYEQALKQASAVDEIVLLHLVKGLQANPNEVVYYFNLHSVQPLELEALQQHQAEVLQLPTIVNFEPKLFKTYGDMVGVEHFVREVIAQHHVDDVAIYYTDEKVLPIVRSTLKRLGVEATYSRGVPFTETEAYTLVEAVLEYVTNFETMKLKAAFKKNYLGSKSTELDKKVIGKILSLAGVEYGVRIPTIIENYINETKSDSTKDFSEEEEAKFNLAKDYFLHLNQQVQALHQLNKPLQLFKQLIRDMVKNSKELNADLKSFSQYIDEIEQYQSTFETFDEFSQFLLKQLGNLSVGARAESFNAVRVCNYQDEVVPNRKYVGVFGFNTLSFPRLETSSPFIPMEAYEYLGLLKPEEQVVRDEEWMNAVLNQFEGGIYLYANTFQTEKVREVNASPYWVRLSAQYEPEFIGYTIPTLTELVPLVDGVGEGTDTNEAGDALEDIQAKEPFTMDWLAKDEDGNYKYSLSPTSLSVLMDCNRKYYFKYIVRLKEDFDNELKINTWLSNNVLGTLYHEVFEACIHEMQQNRKTTDDFEAIATEVFKRYKALYSPQHESHYAFEIERMKKVMAEYAQFIKTSEEEGWVPFGVELPVDGVIDLEPYLNESCEIAVTGIVDRVDMRVVDGQTEYRTIDYKTGKAAYVKQYQLMLYNEALKKKLNSNVTESAFYMIFDSSFIPFTADFVEEVGKDKKTILEKLKEKFTNFHLNEIAFDQKKQPCSYCSYQYICKGLGGTEDDD